MLRSYLKPDLKKLDGVGLVDNRPSINKLHQIVKKTKTLQESQNAAQRTSYQLSSCQMFLLKDHFKVRDFFFMNWDLSYFNFCHNLSFWILFQVEFFFSFVIRDWSFWEIIEQHLCKRIFQLFFFKFFFADILNSYAHWRISNNIFNFVTF